MKTEQEQIKEMMLDVPQTVVAYDANPKGQHLYGEQRLQIAEILYDKGYDDVSEYKAEIERLKAEFKQLETNAEILARGVRDLNHENYELTEKVKQVQIDVLNKLKDSYGLYYLSAFGVKERMLADILNPMIEELKK